MTEKAERDKKTLVNLYSELNKLGQNGEYERAIKTANKILSQFQQEFLAFHYKVICLIELLKFDEAIRLLNGNAQFEEHLVFEKAYCYYRANRHEEALKIIAEIDELDARTKELKAQILYRIEDYQSAASLYREIIKNSDDDYEDERHTNLTAAIVYLNENNKPIDDLREDTYELCFNKACLLIAENQFQDAEKKLRQCEKLCREMLEEDEASEEEIDVDLALIRIQLAFVFQKQGRIKEAHHSYTHNLKIKLEDAALIAVASNNVVCINKDQNLFDSKKKMKVALNETLIHKLPSQQRKYIALNSAIFNYYIHQTEQCEKICQTIEKTWPELMTYTAILRALNQSSGDDVSGAILTLEQNKIGDQLFIKLAMAQLHLIAGNRAEACKILENLGENTFKPAIVGALTTLYLAQNDETKALKVFERCVDFYKKNRKTDVDLSSMWRQAAEFHIRNGHPQVAANSLEELLKSNRNDKKLTAQLVLACSQFDKERALKLGKDLPPIASLVDGLDVEALQNAGLSALSVGRKVGTPGATPKADLTPKVDLMPRPPKVMDESKRKHRKGKLPKNYNPEARIDPERWLPKYERSAYRKKRDRRVKEVIKGSQGTASGQAEQFDFTGKVTEQEAESPTVDPSPRTTKFPPKKAQQKKKNKRR